MRGFKIKKIALAALFTAVITACAWIAVPMPFGVSFTLQMFGVCLASFLLGVKGALATTTVYIAIGAAGLPVFSSFTGGISVLINASGGFLWGFLPCAVFCAVASNVSRKQIKYLLMVLAVLSCHIIGVIQFSFVSGVNIWVGFITASLPFLLKDLIFVFIASLVANKIRLRIKI